MRLTKRLEDGSYQVADWVQNENSYTFKNELIQRMGMFDDYEEMYIKNMVDYDHEKRLAYLEGVQRGRQEMRGEPKREMPDSSYQIGVIDGRQRLQAELRELLGLGD